MPGNIKPCIISLLLLSSLWVQGQEHSYRQTDSLKNVIIHTTQDTTRILLLCKLGEAYRSTRSDTALIIAEYALAQSKKIHFIKGEIRAACLVSVLYREKGDLPTALQIALRALRMSQDNGLKPEEIWSNVRVGNVYIALQDYAKGIKYLQDANTILTTNYDDFFWDVTHLLLSNAYAQAGQLDFAAKELQRIRGQNRINHTFDIYVHQIKGSIEERKNNFSAAIDEYRKSINACLYESEIRTTSAVYNSMASIYKKLNLPDSAIYYAKEGLRFAQMLGYKNRIFTASKLLAELYDTTNPAEAVKYYKIAFAANDSIYGPKKVLQLQAMTLKEQERQREAEAAGIAYQNRVRQYAMLGGIGVFLFIALLLFRNNRQKQKANELLQVQKKEIERKNTEAQIEVALERVRSKTMAMHKSSEAMDIAVSLYDELEKLGFAFGASTIIIIDKDSDDMEHWTAGFFQKKYPESCTIPYFKHPYYDAQLTAWKRGDKFFTYELGGAEKKLYDEIFFTKTGYKNFPEQEKKWMRDAESVTFSLAFMKHGAIHWGPMKLSDEQASILQRFAKVFEQSYTRFLDLQKVEAQVRESQVQLALERVRNRAMAMQSSDELNALIGTVFTELTKLDLLLTRCVIWVFEPATNATRWWMANVEDPSNPMSFYIKYHEHPAYLTFVKQWKNQNERFVYDLKGQDKISWDEILFHETELKNLPDVVKNGMRAPERVLLSASFNNFGGINAASLEPLSEEHFDILLRFAKVFDGTYTRFLDLQKAEAQAREAHIEAALERIRTTTMAMHKSDELLQTSKVLFDQFNQLGHQADQLTIGIMNEPDGVVEIFATIDGHQLPKIFRHPLSEPYVMNKVYTAWKAGEQSITLELVASELKAYNHFRNELVDKEMFVTDIPANQKRVIYSSYFSKGMIAFGDSEQPPPGTRDILNRFAKVFDQTYTRFLDLEKAEAQAREALIEAAVERVRTKALAMHKSEDLHNVVVTLKKELLKLNIRGVSAVSMYLEQDDGTIRALDLSSVIEGEEEAPAFKMDVIFRLEDTDPDLWIRKIWNGTENYFVIEADEADFERIIKWLYTIDEKEAVIAEKIIREQGIKKAWLPTVKLEKGKLNIDVLEPPTPEIETILVKMGAAFDLAYKRFLDLQKAEAQALRAEQDLVEIKIARKKAEESLTVLKAAQAQLIQSEKMASLGELTAGIAHEIQNPLNFINNFSEVNRELADELKVELATGNMHMANGIANDIKDNSEKINHHGKRADAIVKGMLQHSRSSSGKKEPTDINALADEYLRLSYHGLRAKDKSFNAILETRFDPAVGKLNVIGQDIGRVLLNLFNNAFYAVSEKKKQQPTVYEPTVTVSTRIQSGSVEIKVADNGTGIPEKVLEKIYQPFFTTKPTGEGTGLGLSLSYDIITKGHGGEMKVDTKEGEGSEFIIKLPLV